MSLITDNTALAREQIMLDRLYEAAKEFYSKPENQKAYEAWKKKSGGKT